MSVMIMCCDYDINYANGLLSLTFLSSMIVMVLVGLLCVPVVGLTCFHMVLVSRGRTTNEQVRHSIHLPSLGKVRFCSNIV